jgi:hypothetical protein
MTRFKALPAMCKAGSPGPGMRSDSRSEVITAIPSALAEGTRREGAVQRVTPVR